jgi:hypothetical protein
MRERKSFKQICVMMLGYTAVAFIIMQFLPDKPHGAPWWVWSVGLGIAYVSGVFSFWFAQHLTDWTFVGIAWLWRKVVK